MTLAEMAVSYRRQADILRHRIQLVEELPAWNQEEVIAKTERLRLLEACLLYTSPSPRDRG